MRRYSGMGENKRIWNRIYGIVFGLSLAFLGMIGALITPVVGFVTMIAGVAMAAYTANKYKKA